MSNDDFLALYSKLSYPMQKRTDKVLELKNKINKKDWDIVKYFASACASGIYIFLFFGSYKYLPPINSILNWFSNEFSVFGMQPSIAKGVYISTAVAFVHYVVFFIFMVSSFLTYLAFVKKHKLEIEFKKICKLIKDCIAADFCNCKVACNCKDDYFKYMESRGVDLIL